MRCVQTCNRYRFLRLGSGKGVITHAFHHKGQVVAMLRILGYPAPDKRMVAKLHAIKAELRRRMHEPVADVGAWLRKVVNGYYRYHAVPGNIDRLNVFGQRLRRLWRLILRRRSQRSRSWNRTTRIFKRWIPAPRVLHPYPTARFLATHPMWEPYA